MRLSRVLLAGCLAAGVTGPHPAFGQFPGMSKSRARKQRQQNRDDGAQAVPPGVPVPADSPVFEAFRRLEQQSVYHQRMTISANDPRMAQMMEQMGFAPVETITSGDTKQVSMHLKMPALGQVEDFELRSVVRNGRMAKRWYSPASGRILKEQDAKIASQLAQAEAQYAGSIARNLAGGPMGWASAAMSAGGMAASAVMAARVKKAAHEFFEWTCMDSAVEVTHDHREPPPLTDLRVVGVETLDGVAVTGYEFYVHQDGRFHGPVEMYVAKETGLPMRIGMSDARAGGGMQMDYFGFNQGGDFEVPPCLSERK